eukprot:CAMPEP_0118915632 /NCGR_PEP_ID=MMETSP1166-20130328/15761_1 /TAXON_ID=1104430 /ORGANISM="Chrysoreinhardia sp, Strain CCMP3193" /LENGTH=74 /DNA_ID=CAMNT_0006855351 /DNA_START=51 /DNA_END=272 /DNA_ORIENTATION=+
MCLKTSSSSDLLLKQFRIFCLFAARPPAFPGRKEGRKEARHERRLALLDVDLRRPLARDPDPRGELRLRDRVPR